MGLDFGLQGTKNCVKRKFRWLFMIPDICASGINSLPPARAARPTLSFKETAVEHLIETVYYPVKPEWKPIDLVLYDLSFKQKHVVFDWIQKQYDPKPGMWKRPASSPNSGNSLKLDANLILYDGCGNSIETWILENIWPQSVNFDDLDMGDSMYLTCNITLRYDRAYIQENS